MPPILFYYISFKEMYFYGTIQLSNTSSKKAFLTTLPMSGKVTTLSLVFSLYFVYNPITAAVTRSALIYVPQVHVTDLFGRKNNHFC